MIKIGKKPEVDKAVNKNVHMNEKANINTATQWNRTLKIFKKWAINTLNKLDRWIFKQVCWGKEARQKKSTRKKLLYKHAYAFMENYKMQTNLQWQKGGQLTIGVNGG